MHYFAIVFSSILMCSSALAASVPTTVIPDLADTLNQRFAIMKDVAGYKLQNKLPVEDLPREQTVLEKARRSADAARLTPDSVTGFVQAQMEISKAIQYRYLDRWRIAPETNWQPRPLNAVRARILELDTRILGLISQQLLAGGGFGEEQKAMLARQLDGGSLPAWGKAMLIDNLAKIRGR